MESKEKLIKDLQFYVFNFNEYWEDPITESELVKNTKETCEELISCCSLLNTKINSYKIHFSTYELILMHTFYHTKPNELRDLQIFYWDFYLLCIQLAQFF